MSIEDSTLNRWRLENPEAYKLLLRRATVEAKRSVLLFNQNLEYERSMRFEKRKANMKEFLTEKAIAVTAYSSIIIASALVISNYI